MNYVMMDTSQLVRNEKMQIAAKVMDAMTVLLKLGGNETRQTA